MTEHRPGRGCPCEKCVKRREANNAYTKRKRNGEQPLRRRGTLARPATATAPTGRLMESKTGDAVVVHWMPKEAEEWECPKCGRWFLKVYEKWTEPWVA